MPSEIDHVIVHERRGMEKLESGGEFDPARARISDEFGSEQHQCRAQSLASGTQDVIPEFANHLSARVDGVFQRGFDELHRRSDPREGAAEALFEGGGGFVLVKCLGA